MGLDFSKIPDGHAEGEEPVVFYYNQEERLKRAPQSVRDYYEGKITAFKPGLFKALVSTKANRFMLFSLVICFAVVVFNIFFGPKANVETYKGIPMTLTAASFEEQVYVSLKIDDVEKRFKGEYKNGVPIFVRFSALDVDNQVVLDSNSTDLYLEKNIFIRTKFNDFELASINAEIDVLDKKINLKTKVEKR